MRADHPIDYLARMNEYSFMILRSLSSAFGSLCLCVLGGCVVYPVDGGEALLLPPGPPSINVGFYGSPAGYSYGSYPVYVYNGRPCYYVGGRRYWYTRGPDARYVDVNVNRNVNYHGSYSSGYHRNYNRYNTPNRSYNRNVNVNVNRNYRRR